MSSECEVSRMFIRYMQQVIRNERINIYLTNLKNVKETPFEEWLWEETFESGYLEERLLSVDEITHLECYVENERLAMAIAPISPMDKMILYQYYYSELNDVEIGNYTGKTSQAVNKRRRQALKSIKKTLDNL